MKILLFVIILAVSSIAPADGQEVKTARAEAVFGENLMTPAERDRYRQQLWDLKTEWEREQFRRDHRRRMEERARERQTIFPEEVPEVEFPRGGKRESAPAVDDFRGRQEPVSPPQEQEGVRRRSPSGGERNRDPGRWPDDGLRRWPAQ